MVVVIFELVPVDGKRNEYLDLAAKLKPQLTGIDGFISIERFQSLANPEKILSLSFWKTEASVVAWRNAEMHRDAQAKGRERIFRDYRLTVATTIRSYGMNDREQAPADSRRIHRMSEA